MQTKIAQKSVAWNRRDRNSAARQSGDYPYIVENGEVSHIVIPIAEYEQILLRDMVAEAVAKINDPNTKYISARQAGLNIAGRRIAAARKAKGLTQQQLASKLRIPQSQLSRIENHPDKSTLRTLKRIAAALNVNVRALV